MTVPSADVRQLAPTCEGTERTGDERDPEDVGTKVPALRTRGHWAARSGGGQDGI